MRILSRFMVAAFVLAFVGVVPVGAAGSCIPGAETLCFQDDRFAVEADWEDADAMTGRGQVLPSVVGDTGFFYLDDARYLEQMIAVLDGCGINDRYWVFLVGLSDYQQDVTVTDTETGATKVYASSLGQFPHIIDTDAFVCMESSSESLPEGGVNTHTMQLVEGRFWLELNWQDFMGNTGPGMPEAVSSHSGHFAFFDGLMPNLAVKLFDGSAQNGSFGVVFGGNSSVEFTLNVTDLCGRATRTYFSPLGVSHETVADLTAFPADADCGIFGDGFESGDTSAWSGP